MKFASFRKDGKDSYGIVPGDRIVDLGERFGNRARDLRALIEAGLLEEAGRSAATDGPSHGLREVEFLPVIPNPGQIICVGLNYGDHVRETNREVTEKPALFLRVAASQVGHGADIMPPPESVKLDYEGEIAVIIGKPGRRIAQDKMIHGIAQQIAHISAFTPLAAGDVIVTGTPGGVGSKRTPPVWMQPGDTVEVEVDAIGVLRNSICAEGSAV